jgi:type I restriction enzyme, S subunit
MNSTLQTKKIGEVCIIGDGNHSSKYPKKNEMIDEGIPFIRGVNLVNDCVSWTDMKFISKEKHDVLKKGHLKTGDILFTNRGEIGKIAIVGSEFDGSNLNSQVAWFRCGELLNNKFLFYFLSSPLMTALYSLEKNGAALQQFTIGQINKLFIPIPPLTEQQRIVKILDETFELIAKAKNNSKKNLQNSKDVFESYLQSVFVNPENDWKRQNIGKFLKLEYGKPLDKKNRNSNGKFPVYGANGEKDRTDKYYYDNKTIIIGRKGSAGELNLTEEKFWPLDVTYFVTFDDKKYNLKFIYFLLSTLKITRLAKGVKPGINRNDVYLINVFTPNLEKQKSIVVKLDALLEKTKKLESIYKQKLTDLEEFKKSILNKAFSGEL